MRSYGSCYAIRAALRAVLISGVATLRGLRATVSGNAAAKNLFRSVDYYGEEI
jgi:hypothetical protein